MRNRIKEVIQSPLFGRQKKKLPRDQIRHLDEIVRTIARNPEAGIMKLGDLQGVRVYKFRMGGIQILLAYEVSEYTLYLYTFGSHENFYRILQKHTSGVLLTEGLGKNNLAFSQIYTDNIIVHKFENFDNLCSKA